MKIPTTSINIEAKTLEEFLIDDYRVFLKVQGLTCETIMFYMKYILRFINYSKIDSLESFNNNLKIKISYNKLFDRNLKNSTLDKFRKTLIKYYSFLVENEIVEKNYWRQLTKVKQSKSLPGSLSDNEIEVINNYILQNYKIDFYRYRTYMIFNTILNTWLRRNELTQLKRKNVTSQYIKIENWKGQKDRIVYIPKSFSKQLLDYLEIQDKNNEYVFCNGSWKQITNDWINRLFRHLKKWVGIVVYPHLVRHTYASLCVKRWINIYTLQQQMGHTDLKTTSIYLYLNSKESREEVQKLNI